MRSSKTGASRESSKPARPRSGRPARVMPGRVVPGRDADRAVTALYLTNYRSLVRVAALLVQDPATAEEIVQDSFVTMHAAWRRRPDIGHALSCLRRSVIDRCRSVSRSEAVVDGSAPELPPDRPGVSREGSIELGGSAFIAALRTLPARQREVVVLRYFADLPEAQIAPVIGISEGAVRCHAEQAMSSLLSELGRAND